MMVKTNAGEIELTAEMVCRGMVFRDPKTGPYTLDHYDPYVQAWFDNAPSIVSVDVALAHDLLGCDPAIASRADCEHFGVHGDAAAHGFARLRDGGAVDVRNRVVNGAVIITGAPTFNGGAGERFVMNNCHARVGDRFVGLNADHASPEDVRRLCCGERWHEADGIRTCTLAIGDHDEHEDIAHGVKWSAGAERYLSNVARVDAAVKTVSAFNANLRASAALLAGPSCGRCGKATEPSTIGPTMLVLPVGGYLNAEAPVCKVCLAEVNKDITAWTIRDGRIERKATRVGWYSHQMAAEYGSSVWSTPDGREVQITTATFGEDHKTGWSDISRVGEVVAFVRDGQRPRGWRQWATSGGNGFRVGGPYVFGVDPARGHDSTAIYVQHLPGQSGSFEMRDHHHTCPNCGGRSRHCCEPIAVAFCAFVAGLKRWAESAAGKRAELPAPPGGWRSAEQIDREVSERGRRNREAPLVALVNAVPEGLDPIGWRAAVLAVCEKMTPQDWQDDQTGEWLQRCALGKESPDGRHRASIKVVAWTAYQRAISPAPKVERVRITWKTRGPVLSVDDGRDE